MAFNAPPRQTLLREITQLRAKVVELESEVARMRVSAAVRETVIEQLRHSLAEFCPDELTHMCASCKSIMDAEGAWKDIEVFIAERCGSMVSHSICPSCASKLYPDLVLSQLENA